MFKNILVASDASEYSRHAFAAAVELAKKFDAEIMILHVISQAFDYDYRGLPVSGTSLYSDEKIADIGEKVMHTTIEGIETGNVAYSMKTLLGFPSKTIIEILEKDNFDLVVMGSRGHGLIPGALMGSVTMRVLGSAPCPVLVVR